MGSGYLEIDIFVENKTFSMHSIIEKVKTIFQRERQPISRKDLSAYPVPYALHSGAM